MSTGALFSEERRVQILELIRQRKKFTVHELCKRSRYRRQPCAATSAIWIERACWCAPTGRLGKVESQF